MQDLTDSQASPPDEWVTLTSRSSMWEASALRLHFESSGVAVIMPDEYSSTMGYGVGRFYGGIRLQVPKSQLQEAHTLMKEWEASRHPAPLECPVCNSQNIVMPDRLKGIFISILFFGLGSMFYPALFLGIIFPIVTFVSVLLWWLGFWEWCKCRDCKHKWKIKKHAP